MSILACTTGVRVSSPVPGFVVVVAGWTCVSARTSGRNGGRHGTNRMEVMQSKGMEMIRREICHALELIPVAVAVSGCKKPTKPRTFPEAETSVLIAGLFSPADSMYLYLHIYLLPSVLLSFPPLSSPVVFARGRSLEWRNRRMTGPTCSSREQTELDEHLASTQRCATREETQEDELRVVPACSPGVHTVHLRHSKFPLSPPPSPP